MTNYEKIKSSDINAIYKLLSSEFELSCSTYPHDDAYCMVNGRLDQHGSCRGEIKYWLESKPEGEQTTNYEKLKSLNCHEMAEYIRKYFDTPCIYSDDICKYHVGVTCKAPDGYTCVTAIEKWLNAEKKGRNN